MSAAAGEMGRTVALILVAAAILTLLVFALEDGAVGLLVVLVVALGVGGRILSDM